MDVAKFQLLIADIYGQKDAARGLAWTFAWLVEEVGELGAALRNLDAVRRTGRPESRKLATAADVDRNLREEFADVLAWLVTLANMNGVDLEEALRGKYPGTCIKCGNTPCACKEGAA
ncbi:MAG: nucleotide pyrophosphohydrolase [Planctomycetaceae bacterium]|nr:nucleotide pyrophosphohydrolase [Planctomycetaceae bacterium]